MGSMDWNEALAVRAYMAYGESTVGLNYQGKPMPQWVDLSDAIRSAWIAAAVAVEAMVK